MALQRTSSDSIQLQERDFAFLLGLFESRVMTLTHVAELYFEGKGQYAKKRVQRIKAAGLVRERKRGINIKGVLSLTSKAFAILKNEGKLSSYPSLVLGKNSFEARSNVSELTLRHELEIMDVKSAFLSAITKTSQILIRSFVTWPILCQFESWQSPYGGPRLVKPDGFLSIHEKEEGGKGYSYDFFLAP